MRKKKFPVVSVVEPSSKAVFLDRDGTVNALTPGEYILNSRDIRLLPGTAKAIRKLNRLGYLVIIITNQGTIGRGVLTEKKLDEIHAIMIRRLARKGAKIDAVYHCPHHPRAILPGHAIKCACRKPNAGMILNALRHFAIDKKKSFLIGDATYDILAGKRARIRTILVKTGYGGKDGKHDVKPDFIAKNLLDAVKFIHTDKN
ncbi:MAG: HAD family hydrolase [bacterium]|nr:HAD family hydrolase [bacterium]